MNDIGWVLRDTDEIKIEKYAIRPEEVYGRKNFASLREVEMRGSLEQAATIREVQEYAEKHTIGIGEIKVEWVMHVHATGYRLPQKVEEKFATFDRPEHDVDGVTDEYYREQISTFLEMARQTANAPGGPKPITIEFHIPQNTEEPPVAKGNGG